MPATHARPAHPDDAQRLAEVADVIVAEPSLRPTAVMRALGCDATAIRRLQRHWRRHHRGLISAAARRRRVAQTAAPDAETAGGPITTSTPAGYTIEILVDPIAMMERCRRTGATHVRLRVIAEDVR